LIVVGFSCGVFHSAELLKVYGTARLLTQLFPEAVKIMPTLRQDIKDYYGVIELAGPKLAMLPDDNRPAVKVIALLDGCSCAACRYPTIARDNNTMQYPSLGHTPLPVSNKNSLPYKMRFSNMTAKT
jgi:hypothetical protein